MVGQTIAFVGLGAMGSGMARCVARHGFNVRAFDVRPEPLRELVREGALAVGSSAEAAEGAAAAVVIVLTADQACEAVFGSDGLAERLAPGSFVVCSTTMAPARARELADQAQQRGLSWLDAPVSGGTERAAAGSLTTMVGAEPADLERARQLLESFSKDIFHLGPVGAGSTAKMVNQLLVYNHLAATAEAFTLCRKLGADAQSIFEVIRTAMGTSAVFESRFPKLIDGSYQSGGSMRIALKDLGILEEAARDMGMPIPMTALATQLFRATAASGVREADDLAIARLMAQLAGLSSE